VFFTPGDIRVLAIDRRGGREDELLDALVFGEFEQVLCRNDICPLVADRVFNRRADASLGSKVDDGVERSVRGRWDLGYGRWGAGQTVG
jgi:hypothetical protein